MCLDSLAEISTTEGEAYKIFTVEDTKLKNLYEQREQEYIYSEEEWLIDKNNINIRIGYIHPPNQYLTGFHCYKKQTQALTELDYLKMIREAALPPRWRNFVIRKVLYREVTAQGSGGTGIKVEVVVARQIFICKEDLSE